MTPRIVTFIRLLRTQGLPVSVAESLDALHSVSQVGVHDRDLLRFTLRTALVKSHQDFPTFDALFERFFTVPRRRRRRRGHPQDPTSTGVGQRPTPQHNGLPTTPVLPTTPPTPPGLAHRPAQEPRHETPDPAPEEAAQALALQELEALEEAWQAHMAATRSPREATLSEHAETQRSQM